MIYRGRIENGMAVLEGDARPADGTIVDVVPVEPAAARDEADPLYRLLEFAVPTGIPDLAENLDHYLYGHPKVSDAGP
ncbi:MAG: hypothetical protein JW959_08435 [Pirellulales bacterium]|nr:hypothetical protein [Pirellulales bacterium]